MANLQLAKNLRKYRKARGYTQDKLSKYLNISRQAYSNYERANRDPDIGLLIRLCELYNVSMEELIIKPLTKPISSMNQEIIILLSKENLMIPLF